MKVGGSALTDKKTGRSFVDEVTTRVSREISKSAELVIVTGAGYEGHRFAKRHKLRSLDRNQRNWARLRYIVGENSKKLVKKLIDRRLAPMEISTIGLFITSGGHIKKFNSRFIYDYVKIGFIPVLHADAPIDVKKGVSVLSGDAIATEIAHSLRAKLLIYGSDVEGIYDKNGNLLKKVDQNNLESVHFWKVNDVSGGLMNKIKETRKLHGTKVVMINLRKDGRLRDVMLGKRVGTIIG